MRGGLALLLAVMLLGCAQQRVDDEGVRAPDLVPTYEDLRDATNARASAFSRLWARATLVVHHRDDDGEISTTQGDGYLQIITPDRLSLSLGKAIDRMYFFLGSNEDYFWWVDTLDRDARYALVGTHAGASRARAAEFGVPIHPLDLMDLLGIMPLPQHGSAPTWDPRRAAWSVVTQARWGTRQTLIDPIEMRPIEIVLLDDTGQIGARATLREYKRVDEFDGQGLRPEIASEISIELPAIDTDVLVDLGAVRIVDRLPRDIVFDLPGLLRKERIDDIRSLDDEPAA